MPRRLKESKQGEAFTTREILLPPPGDLDESTAPCCRLALDRALYGRSLAEELADPLGFDLICGYCGVREGHSDRCPNRLHAPQKATEKIGEPS